MRRVFTEEQARARIVELTGREPVKAYKLVAFDDDQLFAIRGKFGLFRQGGLYFIEGDVIPCENGYHACPLQSDLEIYRPGFNVVTHEVLVGSPAYSGNVVAGRYLYVGRRV